MSAVNGFTKNVRLDGRTERSTERWLQGLSDQLPVLSWIALVDELGA